MHPKFCLFYLRHLKDSGILDSRYGKGVTIKHLVKSSLLSIPIPLPPLPLQQSFATKIEAIEKQKELIKRSIAEVETLLASRMQHYFG
jgi:type I restriction enzyme S subunit